MAPDPTTADTDPRQESATHRTIPAGTPAFFADPEQEATFRSRGYAVVPLLPADVARSLGKALAAVYPPSSSPMTYANVDEDRTFMQEVTRLTAPIWDEHLAPRFPDHEVVFTTCVVKHPGQYSMMDAHEDGTFVDERFHRSATLWLPLVPCRLDDDSGLIAVLPGSHLLATASAGANVREWHRAHRHHLTRHLVPIPTALGEAVMWDSRLLHGSLPNRSDRSRFAVVAELVPRSARLVHIEALGRTRRRAYSVDARFHLDHSPIAVRHIMPDYPVVAEFDEEPVHVGAADIARLCDGDAPVGPDEVRPIDDWYPPQTEAPTPSPLSDPTLVARFDALASVAVTETGHLLRCGWDPTSDAERAQDSDALDRASGAVAGFSLTSGLETPLPATAEAAARGGILRGWFLWLAPGASASLRPWSGGREVLVGLMVPGGDAGVASPGGARRVDLGEPIETDPSEVRQLWNDGHEPLRLLLIHLDQEAGP